MLRDTCLNSSCLHFVSSFSLRLRLLLRSFLKNLMMLQFRIRIIYFFIYPYREFYEYFLAIFELHCLVVYPISNLNKILNNVIVLTFFTIN